MKLGVKQILNNNKIDFSLVCNSLIYFNNVGQIRKKIDFVIVLENFIDIIIYFSSFYWPSFINFIDFIKNVIHNFYLSDLLLSSSISERIQDTVEGFSVLLKGSPCTRSSQVPTADTLSRFTVYRASKGSF